MDLKKLKDIFSQLPVVLFILTNISRTWANEDDVFKTTVSINPPSTEKDTIVTFTCDFTLIGGKDLHLLYWETLTGGRLLIYNHKESTTEKNSPYEEKILNSTYEVLEGSSRRHNLTLRVDNCDRATYQCLVLNQDDWTQGQDQKTLEIKANLPAPVPCMSVDGDECKEIPRKEDPRWVYSPNGTTITKIRCKVTSASVAPEMTLLRDGVDMGVAATVTALDACLHDGVQQTESIKIEKDVEASFVCRANYGGTTNESLPFGISPDKPPPADNVADVLEVTGSDSANVGMILGIVAGVIVVIVIVLLILYIVKKRNSSRRSQYMQQDVKNKEQANALPSKV